MFVEPGPGAALPIVLALTPHGDTAGREVRIDADPLAATFDGVTAGDYDLRVSLADGRAAAGPITVRVGMAAVVVVSAMAGNTMALRVERVDDVPLGEAARFDARALRDLPSAGDLWSLVDSAAPFVIADRPDTARLDTGGLGIGRSALVGSRGESWGLTTVMMDGLPVRLPTRTGQLAILADMNAASSVTVASGLAPIDVDTPGVVVSWMPRRAGSTWSGGADLSATTPGMVGVNGLPHAPSLGRIDDWRGAGVFAGGPVASRAGLFVSTAFARATYLEREAPPQLTAETRSAFAHLTTRPSSSSQLRVLGAVEAASYPFMDRWQFALRDLSEGTKFGRALLAWDRSSTRLGHGTLMVGVQRGTWRPDVPTGVVGGTIDRVVHGIVPPPASALTLTQVDGRGEWRTKMRRRGGVTTEGMAGVTIRRSSTSADVLALPTVAELVAGQPARAWVPRAPVAGSRRTVTELGLLGGARWMLGPRVTVDSGLRIDVVRGENGGTVSLRSKTVSPRISFRWSPAALSFFAGVARYAGGHAMSFLAFGDPGEVTWDVHRWNDGNGDGRYGEGEAGVLVARAGSGAGVGALDAGIRVPRTTEWVAGAEVRPTAGSVLRGSVVIRRQADLVGVVNTGLSASDFREFLVPDINADEGSAADDQLLRIYERLPSSFGRDALLLTNPDAEPIAHDGIELTYEISSSRWFMLFGATAYRTLGYGGTLGHSVLENDQLVPGDRYWNPNALKDSAGRLFFDRAYVGKWTTAYRAPGDVRLAAVVRYQDGQPFTRYVVASDLAGGPEITHAYPVGRTRFTYTATVDLRVEKGIGWGRGRRASMRLDAFNLTNHANELEEDVLSGPTFRLSSIVQPPRTFRLGARLEF